MSGQTWLESDKKQIQLFLANVEIIKSLTNQLGTKQDSTQLREQLNEKREETKELDKSISRKIKARETLEIPPAFASHIESFMKVSVGWKNLYKESIMKSMSMKLLYVTEEASSPETNEPAPALFQKMECAKIYKDKSDLQNEIILERNRDIQQIKQETQTVGDMLQQTMKLLNEQQTHLDQIDKNLTDAVAATDNSVHRIALAAKHHNQSAVYSGAALGGVIAGSLGCLLGPVGGIVSGSAGAYIGSVIGNNVSKLQNAVVDKEMLEHYAKTKWVSDNAVHFCMNCRTQFSQVLRKHHCRACGKIFCGSCSSKKIPFKFPCMDAEKMARVCDSCYNDHWNKVE